MSPKTSHLHETSLYVDDLEAARAFYQSVFGLEALLEDERMIGLALPGRAMLLLFRRDGAANDGPHSSPPAQGTQHLCLAIPASSVSEWERHLMLRGIVIESNIVQTHGGVSLYFRDPDGHSLEVASTGSHLAG